MGTKRSVGFAISLIATIIFLQAIIPTNSFAQDSISLNSLSGDWISEDYECPWGTFRTEGVSITIDGNQINAIKTDSGGDQCVPTGSTTFYGSLPTVLPIGKSFPVTFVAGTPENPACCTEKAYLKFIDIDTFQAESKFLLIFSREIVHFRRASSIKPIPDADNSWDFPVYSTKDSRLFHRSNCNKINSKDGDLITFPSKDDAEKNGGKPCSECNP